MIQVCKHYHLSTGVPCMKRHSSHDRDLFADHALVLVWIMCLSLQHEHDLISTLVDKFLTTASSHGNS